MVVITHLIRIQSGFNPRQEVGYLIRIEIRIRAFTHTQVSLIGIQTMVVSFV